jgi:hypothetical protein
LKTGSIGGSAHLTAHDASQPNLVDFFDFNGVPWASPPTTPVTAQTLAADCLGAQTLLTKGKGLLQRRNSPLRSIRLV